MENLTFDRSHALDAIEKAQQEGIDWLYQNYPKPGGNPRRSSTGFLMYEGLPFPLKPLGRLASEIAGRPRTDNPNTNKFRLHFESLGFQLIESETDEAEKAALRQKRLAEVWSRPDQARFRRGVFTRFGARCLITGCDTLAALEAAHIQPVSDGGVDDAWNGIPLRADMHRLFDASLLTIDANTWRVSVDDTIRAAYKEYDNFDISSRFENLAERAQIQEAFSKRNSHT